MFLGPSLVLGFVMGQGDSRTKRRLSGYIEKLEVA